MKKLVQTNTLLMVMLVLPTLCFSQTNPKNVPQPPGLTRRQAQVAFWIAQGKTNDELAILSRSQFGPLVGPNG